jgi:hypothetical protein
VGKLDLKKEGEWRKVSKFGRICKKLWGRGYQMLVNHIFIHSFI